MSRVIAGSARATWSSVWVSMRGGAQLVGGVGDEASLEIERRFEAGQESIDGVAQIRELVVRAAKRGRSCRFLLGDSTGGRGHGPKRSQSSTGHEPPQAYGEHDHDGEGDARLDEELVKVCRVSGLGKPLLVEPCPETIPPMGVGMCPRLWERSTRTAINCAYAVVHERIRNALGERAPDTRNRHPREQREPQPHSCAWVGGDRSARLVRRRWRPTLSSSDPVAGSRSSR